MRIRLAAAVAALCLGAAAHADTLYTFAGPSGPIASPGSQTATFDAAAGTGAVAFTLVGYLSIDGAGSGGFDDRFTLSLNGTDIYSAFFRLGGIGSNTVVLAPIGATQTVTDNGFFNGGTVALNIPLQLVAGSNTLVARYTSAIPQTTSDEGFGLRDVLVTGNAVGGVVPEPATWAMMIGGAGATAGMLRRRRRVRAAFRFA